MSCGELVGIGVGPGDPELITLAALKALAGCTHVFAAASSTAEDSIALSIARPHLPQGVPVTRLGFPMTTDAKALQQAWQDNARMIRDQVAAGERCVFLTLGDPLLYSTFGYLLRALLAQDPSFPVRVIPGITAFQAAAARLRTPLAEGRESMLLVPGIRGAEEISHSLACAENLVILKAGKRYAAIRAALDNAGVAAQSQMAVEIGLPGETIYAHLPEDSAPRPYLSLILVHTGARIPPSQEVEP